MKPTKQDLMISLIDEGVFRVYIRKRFLFVFWRWVEITYQEAENTQEYPIEFNTLTEAENFCFLITE
jgi:hypothetical protein